MLPFSSTLLVIWEKTVMIAGAHHQQNQRGYFNVESCWETLKCTGKKGEMIEMNGEKKKVGI